MFPDITISIVLFLSKTPSSFYLKTQRFWDWIILRLQAKPTQWAHSIELVPISGYLYQHHIGYTSQAQHKPSARAKTKHCSIKNSARMRPCTRIEVITGKTNSPYSTNTKKTNFHIQSTLGGVVVFYFCCDNGSPDMRDVQAGLTDRIVYQRHVGGFLVFLVCGFWFNLQSFTFYVSMWHYTWVSST
jgi:hypothetical protein